MARLLIEDGAGVSGLPRGLVILGQRDARALLMQASQASGIRDANEASLLPYAVSLLRSGLVTEPRRLLRSSALARFEPEVPARAAAVLPATGAAFATTYERRTTANWVPKSNSANSQLIEMKTELP